MAIFAKSLIPSIASSDGNEEFTKIPSPSRADEKYSTVKSMSAVSLWLTAFVLQALPTNLTRRDLTALKFELLGCRSASHRMYILGKHFETAVQLEQRQNRTMQDQEMQDHEMQDMDEEG